MKGPQQVMRYKRTTNLHEDRIGDELVALDIEKGQCYGMNAVATQVWEILSSPKSIEEICEILTSKFEVEDSRCRSEVTDLLVQFERDGLVSEERSSTPSA